MKKHIKRLEVNQEAELREEFLKSLGKRLKRKRKKAGLTQEELGVCISENRSAISRYENGEREISISKLPVMGLYCGFATHELFPQDESRELLDAFSSAVEIVAHRTKKPEEKETDAEQIIRKYYENAENVAEAEPYTEEEFFGYIYERENVPIDSIISAGNFLNSIKKSPQNEEIRYAVANYILGEIITEDTSHSQDEQLVRMCVYYQNIFNRYKSDK